MFFKAFFKIYIYMINLTLNIFGARYISMGKLALAIGSLPAKLFGWGLIPYDENLEAFLKVCEN